jgi:hypothetical protein
MRAELCMRTRNILGDYQKDYSKKDTPEALQSHLLKSFHLELSYKCLLDSVLEAIKDQAHKEYSYPQKQITVLCLIVFAKGIDIADLKEAHEYDGH